ncbi:hypothetical protein K3495_g8321 [Podosphaera aphanis]|nr:hypothetical protein K3495_g8321 [Podosphaera aphanis]
MGKSEAFTALALGRGHYEDEVIWTSDPTKSNGQKYNSRGHPRNPETKKRERDHIRAANEVMLVTGVVEDTATARARKSDDEAKWQLENYIGFRLVEFGRACLYTGVWGVVGFRRRTLLYRSYATMSFSEILRRERDTYSIPHLLYAGLPTMINANISTIPIIIMEKLSGNTRESGESEESSKSNKIKVFFQKTAEWTINYFIIQLQLSAILRQLNIIPPSRNFPFFMSMIPFTANSLIQFKLNPVTETWMLPLAWAGTLASNAGLLLLVLGLDKLKYAISVLVYRQIYLRIPRPLGPSIYSDLPSDLTSFENDSLSEMPQGRQTSASNPTLETSSSTEVQVQNVGRDISEEDEEMNQAQLISFDVEPTEAPDTRGPWSAELRSSNEPKPFGTTGYRMTGLTLLPTMLATQVLRDLVADILLVPLEALVLRVVGRAYRTSAGLRIDDLHSPSMRPHVFGNLIIAWTLQFAIGGTIWCGVTACTDWYSFYRQKYILKSSSRDKNL